MAVFGEAFSNTFLGGAEDRAANAQVRGIDSGINELRDGYSDIEGIYSPYGGFSRAVNPMLGLAGLGTPEEYQQQIDIIQRGPQYRSLMDAGQEQILQSASATGGLRGGNTQRSLADFGRDTLSQAINQRYGQLSGLTDRGLGVAGNLAGARSNVSSGIAGLYGDRGAAEAGGILGKYGAIKDTAIGATKAFTGGF